MQGRKLVSQAGGFPLGTWTAPFPPSLHNPNHNMWPPSMGWNPRRVQGGGRGRADAMASCDHRLEKEVMAIEVVLGAPLMGFVLIMNLSRALWNFGR